MPDGSSTPITRIRRSRTPSLLYTAGINLRIPRPPEHPSPIWLAVRTIVGRGDDLNHPSTTTADWQCTEHGRLWSDPLRWTPDVLLHHAVGTAANVATSSGRHLEGQFVSLFVVPPCPLPLLAEMAGSTYIAPAEAIRTAVDTRSPSRLLRLLDQGVARLKSARGIKLTADGLVHLEATELLQTKTPSHVMDAGLRDALGRSACTLQNLVSVESPAVGDRIHLALTGSITRSPLRCILCDGGAADDDSHMKERDQPQQGTDPSVSSKWLK